MPNSNNDTHRRFSEEVFSYRTNKEDKVFLFWYGKRVMTLKGPAAQKFLSSLQGLDAFQAQLLMAKTTGNFKRGNERRER